MQEWRLEIFKTLGSPAADAQKVKVEAAQSCPTLCDPVDYTAHGILQARILEWVAFPFSRAPSRPRNRTWVSCIGRWILYHLSHLGSPQFNVCLYYMPLVA